MKFFSALLLLCALVGFIATAASQSAPVTPSPVETTTLERFISRKG
ncbi:uncharacterized protein Dana_GF28051 [Drosophila ananassae]|uniref:Uncharacterized protein n=1 Tax=Drosophila ananassae TaxID=7217 RepID=A0A0P9API8_DROAN|nr:uncharacterized protein Dana_GF28051 [Drosophila ananassae]